MRYRSWLAVVPLALVAAALLWLIRDAPSVSEERQAVVPPAPMVEGKPVAGRPSSIAPSVLDDHAGDPRSEALDSGRVIEHGELVSVESEPPAVAMAPERPGIDTTAEAPDGQLGRAERENDIPEPSVAGHLPELESQPQSAVPEWLPERSGESEAAQSTSAATPDATDR